jgi:hypothetical protein
LKDTPKFYECFNSLWKKLDESYPFYYIWNTYKEPLSGTKIKEGDVWFDMITSNYFLPLKGNSLLYQFKDKAFQVPCVEYKKRKKKFVKTYPQFLEFKEIECPWVRIYPYDALFTNKTFFLKHLEKNLNKQQYKDLETFFSNTFVDRKHIIRLG